MTIGARYGRLNLFACALFVSALMFAAEALAAPRAAELGPELPLAEPAGGFVGKLSVTPQGGPAGTHVTVSGEAFAPEQEFDLVWRTVKGRWKVTVAEYHGREFAPVGYRIATARSDKAGHIAASFIAPEDFGFQHDIVVQQGNRLLTQTAFNVEMTVKLAEDKGPLGSPIAIEVQGIGWRELEGSWVLLYDNKFTGFMSAITTGGTARFALTATGHVGRHIIEIQHSDFGSPYRNTQQSPVSDRPVFKLAYHHHGRRAGAAAGGRTAGAVGGAFASGAGPAHRHAGLRRRRATRCGQGLGSGARQDPSAQLDHGGRQPDDRAGLGGGVARDRRGCRRYGRFRRVPL